MSCLKWPRWQTTNIKAATINILILPRSYQASGPGILRPVFTRHGKSWAVHLPLTSCQHQLCCWEEGVLGTKNSLNSWPLSRPRAGSEPELTMSQKYSAAWCFPPVLFQLSCYSLKPEGVFNGGLGITGLTFNSSGVKGPGHCPEPPHVTHYSDWTPQRLPPPWRAFFICHWLSYTRIPWYYITVWTHCQVGFCQYGHFRNCKVLLGCWWCSRTLPPKWWIAP